MGSELLGLAGKMVKIYRPVIGTTNRGYFAEGSCIVFLVVTREASEAWTRSSSCVGPRTLTASRESPLSGNKLR